MLKPDKATSPGQPPKRAENVLFSVWADKNVLQDGGVGPGGDLAISRGYLHSNQCLQGLLSVMSVAGRAAQIVNNFLIKSVERC
jgi:hypothetical protein